jgi:hypothetical protein
VDIGDIINQYQVVEHIGRGGMADVWSARDGKLNRMVAVKTVAHGLSTENDPVGMFKREAQTIAGIEHPHILPVYDFGEHQGSLYIVMRYVSGGSLSGWMDRAPLSIDEAVRVSAAVAQALDHAHAKNVIHLDLKPQNVLLDGHNSPYLADFGLAAALDTSGRAANPGSGTLMYMAPEQLTAETLDRMADVYSFAVMTYHILNGRLPFDGASPLVMKQLQFQSELPEIATLPQGVTEALRKSVSVEPDDRHPTASALIDDIRAALGASISVTTTEPEDEEMAAIPVDLREAATLYKRARTAWDAGQGRFLLGVTHFMVMESTYSAAETHGLELDTQGKQMLLRGALEYDRNIDYWWELVEPDDRRWVCLHTLRSQNAPARVRALVYLGEVPDDAPPRIPRLVAQALQIETDDTAKLTALELLAKRAEMRTVRPTYMLTTENIGRMLNSLARVEIIRTEPLEWTPTVFGPEVDLLLAEMALDFGQPKIAEAAARTVGKIRSESAVKYLADQQRDRRKGALRALAFVRDEAPSLPKSVSGQGRFYAWGANSLRRMGQNPLGLTWRFLFAMFGAALGRGWLMWQAYDLPVTALQPNRMATTVAFGLSFGLVVGLLAVITGELPARLRGFWSGGLQTVFAVVTGLIFGTLVWAVEYYMFLQITDLPVHLLVFSGFCLAFGFVATSLLRLRAGTAVLVTALTTFLPIVATWMMACSSVGGCLDTAPFTVGPFPLIGVLLGLLCGVLLRAQTGLPQWLSKRIPAWNPPVFALVGVGLGIVWTALLPLIFSLARDAGSVDLANIDAIWNGEAARLFTWVSILGLLLLGLLPGLLGAFVLNGFGQIGFGLAAVVGGLVVFGTLNPELLANPLPAPDALFYLPTDFMTGQVTVMQVWTSFLPLAILIALGGHAQLIAREVREWLQARKAHQMAAALGTETNVVLPLNRPRAMLADTATLMEAVDQAREELIKTGAIPSPAMDDNMHTIRVAETDVLQKKYGFDDDMPTTEVKRLQDEDK